MLDINLIIEETDKIKESLAKRGFKADFKKIIKLDNLRKKLINKNEDLKAERNKFSKSKPDAQTIKRMKALGTEIKDSDINLSKIQADLEKELAALPNIVADDVVAGDKENNKIIKTFKTQIKFGFKIKNHVDLATDLALIDYERAAKMSGAGFWVYTGQGALLEWALLQYFVDYHRQNNYTFIIPPFLLTEKSAYTSGHLPKFRDDLFWTQDKLCLNATSEMMLGNYHRDEILNSKTLPLKYYAFSTCFRREAGSYRAEERGMIRGHQFNKIEMFQFTKPENSWAAFDELLAHAQALVEGLDLHYNTVQLAAGDCSAAMAKTVDIEVWIPSMNGYKEVSSVSNALDYQARRGNIKFKHESGDNKFVHTLNASGLATSRILPAILEQNQQADGSVRIPKVLQKYMGNKEFLGK
ncbi:MAG: serine--tRNA ligase [Patescibacteria group bacterium]|jgi:seryl-tRNA synthetase